MLKYVVLCLMFLGEHPEKEVFVTKKLDVTKTISGNEVEAGDGLY